MKKGETQMKKLNVYRFHADEETREWWLTLEARGVFAADKREALEKTYVTDGKFFDERDYRVYVSGEKVKLRGSLSSESLRSAWEGVRETERCER